MKHLDSVEFVDLLDGTLEAARAEHVRGCAGCAARAAALRDTWAEASVVAPSEPSPLFWQHFSARVSDAIRREPEPRRAGWHVWLARPLIAGALAAAVIALVTIAALSTRPSSSDPAAPVTASRPAPAATEWEGDDIEADEAWALLRAVVDELGWDDVQEAGLAPGPGAAGRAVAGLTAEERAALAQVLEEELGRPGV